mgnify:CR=1 FL=1
MTASDVSHEESLFQLLGSIKKNRRSAQVCVVDLGMSQAGRAKLVEKFNVRVVDFPFESHPKWFSLEHLSGSYAWKSSSIKLAIEQDWIRPRPCRVIWLDAGCSLKKGFFVAEALTDSQGFFANLSSGSIGQLTLSGSIDEVGRKLGIVPDKDLSLSSQISAAAMGFNLREPWVRDLLDDWLELCSNKKAISPMGASKSNHRFDQSILSILLASRYRKNWKPYSWPQIFLGFKIHQDID